VDNKLDFYFLEMNTRLQVEHPVSELITGVDLVKLQILVAQGEELPIKQEDLSIKGHAVEIRVYAEDPTNGFLPDIGNLQTYRPPKGVGIRVDDGYEEGMDIPIYYDPMLAKLITYGQTRQEAIDRMIRAIDEYKITGVQTTLPFCKFVMKHPAFTEGHFDTKFVENYYKPEYLDNPDDEDIEKVAAALLVKIFEQKQPKNSPQTSQSTPQQSRWKQRAL